MLGRPRRALARDARRAGYRPESASRTAVGVPVAGPASRPDGDGALRGIDGALSLEPSAITSMTTAVATTTAPSPASTSPRCLRRVETHGALAVDESGSHLCVETGRP
jgi:hypothetical protein